MAASIALAITNVNDGHMEFNTKEVVWLHL